MLTEKQYQDRLRAYFYSYYGKYENESEWFVNPAINKFKAYIPPLGLIITFTCDDEGEVTEEKESMVMDPEKLHEIIEGSCRGMDAIYEDYIIRLVTERGFDILRKNRMLQTCGSIDGRNLYTLS